MPRVDLREQSSNMNNEIESAGAQVLEGTNFGLRD